MRCRINVFQTLRGVGLAVRLLSSFRNNLRDCNLHPEIGALVALPRGLVIVSGATGSGKSTTLAALVEEINAADRRHILTIEDPIEYFLENRRSFIRQREVETHTPSFEQAIVDAMREDPDVLVIGEMRTPETMRLTLNAAETGHLVLTTMHSATAAEALARIEMSFPPESQASIRAQLADCLVGVLSQRLEYLTAHDLRVPHCELLIASAQVKALVRKGEFAKLASAIQTGRDDGMWSFDRYARWMAEKPSWVAPAQAESAPPPPEAPAGLPPVRDEPRPAQAPRPPRAAEPATPAPESPEPGGRIVIDEADTDLDALVDELSRNRRDG